MRRWMGLPITVSYAAAAVALTACVTINVYFPAAEAKEAAKEFVEKVIGDEVSEATTVPGPGGMAVRGPARPWQFDPLVLVGIGPAMAQGQPDITIKTPAIQAIQSRMAGRFDTQLRAHFDSGALGFTNDGLVTVRDAAKIALKDRVAVTQAVSEHGRDAKAVYREVAVANNHPEWEPQIRAVFSRQWIESARSGWWYQDTGGGWKQK